jgi:hypothetical protein
VTRFASVAFAVLALVVEARMLENWEFPPKRVRSKPARLIVVF